MLTIAALSLPVPPALLILGQSDSAVIQLFVVLAVILVAAKLGGEAAARIGQPAVLGELAVGILLGSSVLHVVPTDGAIASMLAVFAQLGLLLLLLEIGLATDLDALFKVGPAAIAVAVVGVVVPFVMGTLFWRFGPIGDGTHLPEAAIFVGAALTATSVGITARIFHDLEAIDSPEARIVIGAAVIDDLLGLVILGVVSGLAADVPVTVASVSTRFGFAVAFLALAIVLGRLVIPRTFAQIERLRVKHALVAFALAFMLSLAALAERGGAAAIIGAFAAGIVLSGVNRSDVIADELRPVGALFTPVFFVTVGASLDVGLLRPDRAGAGAFYTMAGALTSIAMVGKLVAGWAAPWVRYRRLVVGVGMIPRGEVGLIFANIGLRIGILSAELFGAVVVMVIVTTFIAPPVLARLLRRPIVVGGSLT